MVRAERPCILTGHQAGWRHRHRDGAASYTQRGGVARGGNPEAPGGGGKRRAGVERGGKRAGA